MPYRRSSTAHFSDKPSIDDLIEALQDLAKDHGGDALVRTQGFFGPGTVGPYIQTLTVEPDGALEEDES